MKQIISNKNKCICCDCTPDLRLHGIHAVADEKPHVQVLFDLGEEQFAASASQPK